MSAQPTPTASTPPGMATSGCVLRHTALPARSTQAGWRACSIIKSPQASMATCVSVQIGRSDHACCVAQARPSMAKAANAPAKA